MIASIGAIFMTKEKDEPICVIGSGPTAIAACYALIKQGIKPLVLDISSTVEVNKSKINPLDIKKIPRKVEGYHLYSSFSNISRASDVDLLESIGFGGLSSVWGGAISKPTEQEILDWPIKGSDFDSSFDAIDDLFLHFGCDDKYAKYRGLKAPDLIRGLEVECGDINFGSSRIAISRKDSSAVFCSLDILNEWIGDGKIDYKAGIRVDRIVQDPGSEALQIYTSSSEIFTCKKVYLAAGVIGSTLIMMNSDSSLKEVTVRENKILISFWLSRNGIISKHKFPYIFIGSNQNFQSHTQMYQLNRVFLDELLDKLGISIITSKWISWLFKKINVCFSYFSDINSGKLIIKKTSNGFTFITESGISGKELFEMEIKKIRATGLNYSPLPLRVGGKFGYGYHIGGSFPMMKTPGRGETNLYGEPFKFTNLHLVDASVFPSLPTIPLTYLAMANAYRIASSSGLRC